MVTALDALDSKRNGEHLRIQIELPELSGWFLWAYKAIWCVLIVVALASATVLAFRSEARYQAQLAVIYNAGLYPKAIRPDGVGVLPFSQEAHAAFNGDAKLVLIDGHPAKDFETTAALLRGTDGTPVQLELRLPNGALRHVSLTRNRRYLEIQYAGSGLTFTLRRWMQYSVQLVGSLLLLTAAALLFVRRPRDPVAALLSLGIILNVCGVAVYLGSAPLVMLSALSVTMLSFGILFFPDGRVTRRWLLTGALGILFAQCVAVLAFRIEDLQTAANLLSLGTAALCAGAVVAKYRASQVGTARQQIKFAMFGFVAMVAFYALSLVLNQLSDVAGSEGKRAWLLLLNNFAGAMSAVAFSVGLLVALLRYRLYDADTAIGRSAAYGVLTLSFVALFAAAEKFAELIGERYFEHSIGIAAGAIGAAVAATMIVPLHNRVHRWAEGRFQKSLIKLREGLPHCLDDLRETASVDVLISTTLKRIEAGVHTTRQALLVSDGETFAAAGARGVSATAVEEWQRRWLLQDGERMLECVRNDLMFPLRVRLCIETGDEPETVGWLLLGPRPDGSIFSKDDREALTHVAGPIARAIHTAQARESREERFNERLRALEALVAKVLGRFGKSNAATRLRTS